MKETLKKAPGNKPALVSLEQIQKEQALEAKLASLKKELEKNMPAAKSSSSSSDQKSLKKDEDPIAAATLKKEEFSLKKEGKPVVVVDWHNCLEKDDVVPEENLHALQNVLEVADVRIISSVGGEARRKSALKQIRDLLPAETLKKVKGSNVFGTDAGRGERWIGHATTRLKLCLMTTHQSVRKRGSGALWHLPFVATSPTKAEAPLLRRSCRVLLEKV